MTVTYCRPMRWILVLTLGVALLTQSTSATLPAPDAPADMAHFPDFSMDSMHPLVMVMNAQTLPVPFDGWTVVVMAPGQLTIPDGDVRLVNLIVMEGASVTLGAHTHVTIKDQPIDTAFDPDQFGHGVVAMGNITWIGNAKTPWVRLAREPHAGDTTLLAGSAVTGWQPGDRVVIGDTRAIIDDDTNFNVPGVPDGEASWRPLVDHTDSVVVQSVSADGLTVSLSAPLAFDHPAARGHDGTIRFLPFVSNHTRSAILQSENPRGVRGHFMMAERAVADIEYVQFEGLGRTCATALDNTTWDSTGTTPTHIGTCQVGRYALHEHHLIGAAGSAFPASKLVGNAVNSSPKWGLVVHDSHFGLVQQNVVADAVGSGIVTETGQETGNVFDHNLVVHSIGSNFTQEQFSSGLGTTFGTQGDGYWFSGPNNHVTNNIAIGFQDTGFDVVNDVVVDPALRCPTAPGNDPREASGGVDCQPGQLPYPEFSGNEAAGSIGTGMQLYSAGVPDEGGAAAIGPVTTWHVHTGLSIERVGTLALNGFTAIGPYRGDYGRFTGWNEISGNNLTATNVYVANTMVGIWLNQQGYTGGTGDLITGTISGGEIHAVQALGVNQGEVVSLDPTRPIVWTFSNLTVEAVPWYAMASLLFSYGLPAQDGLDTRKPMRLVLQNVNGQSFELFTSRQAPTAPMPTSGDWTEPFTGTTWHNVIGVTQPGLTNAQAFAQAGVTYAGVMAPCTTTMPLTTDDVGNPLFACPVTSPPPSGMK